MNIMPFYLKIYKHLKCSCHDLNIKHRQQIHIELLRDKTNDLGITAITNSGQPGHSPNLSSLMNKAKVLSYPLRSDLANIGIFT